jgi:ribosomal protein S18 acetylase RimI-like enzyme
MMLSSMTIKSATHQDLPEIAECHASAFPHSLSTAMGKKYLKQMLSWYLATDKTFLFFLEEQDQVVGYCGGMIVETNQRMGSASSMAQHSFNEAVKAFLSRPWLVFHKEVISKYRFILKNFAKRWRKSTANSQREKSGNSVVAGERYAALVVIGVRKNLQGAGYGSRLLAAFEQQSMSRGLSKMLLTVRSDNAQAIKSYEKNGWVKTEANRKSTTMRKSVTS